MGHNSAPRGTNGHQKGTNVNMTRLAGIGARMAAARNERHFSQVKAAARLEISDKAYKNYETEKREMPLSVAVKFCEAFDVQLDWLVRGSRSMTTDKFTELAEQTIEAIFTEERERRLALTPSRAAKIGSYILRNCSEKGTTARDEVGPIFDMLEDK